MKNFTTIQLLLGCLLLLVFYSCAPKYGAHFSKSDNFHKPDKQTIAPEGEIAEANDTSDDLEPVARLDMDSEVPEPAMEQYVVSSQEIIPAVPSPSISKLVEKHKNRIDEIEKSELESKEMKREMKKAKKLAKKEIKKEVKKEVKKIKERSDSDGYVLMMILAVIIPPLAVGLNYGIVDKFWISLLLTILFFIPGMIYSLIVVHDHYR